VLAQASSWRYTPDMQGYRILTLVLLLISTGSAQLIPSKWRVVKDSKGVCQIAVPPEWDLLAEASGAAILQDTTTAIAVVTSQPGQVYKPLTDSCKSC